MDAGVVVNNAHCFLSKFGRYHWLFVSNKNGCAVCFKTNIVDKKLLK